MTMLCLVVAFLLILGLLHIEIGPLPPSSWLAIVCAQVLTAIIVAGVTSFSSREKDRSPRDYGSDLE